MNSIVGVLQESTGHEHEDEFTIDIIGVIAKETRSIINFHLITSDDTSRIASHESADESPRHFIVASGQAILRLKRNEGIEKAEYALNVENKLTIPAYTEWTLELEPRTIILTFTQDDSYTSNIILYDYK